MFKEMISKALLMLSMAATLHITASFTHPFNTPTTCYAASSARCTSVITSKLSESFNGEDNDEPPKKKGFFASFFEEMDAFVDDATSRRLGAGAQYYGKRKSGFYGNDDANRKRDKNVADGTEDYRGPSNAGYFKWLADPETGEVKPVTRLKEVNIEKKPRI